MDTSPLLILLICALVVITAVAIAFFRSGRNTLRRDRGVPIGFGIDASQGNTDSSGADQLHHHHHHHHSPGDAGHHHSHGGADSGGSHHGGGSDGGSAGGGHH